MTNQPFNDLFVTTFKIKSEVVAFLENFIETEISSHLDMDSLTLDDNSYLTPGNDKFEADVVYDCLWKGQRPVKVSLLFEHKSSYPDLLALQLLRYFLEIWEKQHEQGKPLTVIIPIVLYHGEKGFTYKPLGSFFDEIKDPALRKFIPDFQALIVNLANFEDDDLAMVKLSLLYSMALLFKHKRDWNYVLEHYQTIFSYTEATYDQHTVERYTISLFYYLWAVNKPDETTWGYLRERVPSKIRDMAETFYDYVIQKGFTQGEQVGFNKGEQIGFSKGKEFGLTQGLTQGEQRKAKRVILKLDTQFPHFSDQEIAGIVDVPVSFVKKMRAEIRKRRTKDMN